MLFYIITILLGFAFDYKGGTKRVNNTYRRLFVLWLYVFLCFGYMTGSDWRNYEQQFDYMQTIQDLGWVTEWGFSFIFLMLKKVFVDFWLVIGLLKCLYLYTLIRVVKLITPYWLSVVSLFITGGLGFMLIDNPLRFMTALILVNIAMELCLKNKRVAAFLLAFLSFIIHNASVFFVVLIWFMLKAEKIAKWNKMLVVCLFLAITVVSSSTQLIESLRSMMVSAAGLLISSKSYSSYTVENNAVFFSLGNLVSIIMFFIVILTRDIVVRQNENGRFIYGMTITYCILNKLFLIIPTGFRLTIPFAIFYMVYMVNLIRSKSILKWVFILYVSFSYPPDLWNTYKYIPYSNSIPYIVMGHKDYETRYRHNIEAYQKRTGKYYNGDFE